MVNVKPLTDIKIAESNENIAKVTSLITHFYRLCYIITQWAVDFIRHDTITWFNDSGEEDK